MLKEKAFALSLFLMGYLTNSSYDLSLSHGADPSLIRIFNNSDKSLSKINENTSK